MLSQVLVVQRSSARGCADGFQSQESRRDGGRNIERRWRHSGGIAIDAGGLGGGGAGQVGVERVGQRGAQVAHQGGIRISGGRIRGCPGVSYIMRRRSNSCGGDQGLRRVCVRARVIQRQVGRGGPLRPVEDRWLRLRCNVLAGVCSGWRRGRLRSGMADAGKDIS
jgi:hypothetical protein